MNSPPHLGVFGYATDNIFVKVVINGFLLFVQKLVGCKEMGDEVLKAVESQLPAAL